MKLDVKLKTLGPVNHAPLKAAMLAATPEMWLEEQLRQKSFDVHAKTHSMILLFAEGWPDIQVKKHSAWDRYSAYALPLIRQIIRDHYQPHGTVIRAMLAKLLAGKAIDEHMDEHPSFAVGHRIHVPLVTNDRIRFMIDGDDFYLKEGIAYEVSNLDYHAVANESDEDRVHFIFDYVEDASA